MQNKIKFALPEKQINNNDITNISALEFKCIQ